MSGRWLTDEQRVGLGTGTAPENILWRYNFPVSQTRESHCPCCPHAPRPAPWSPPAAGLRCSLYAPLWLVIPPEGTWIPCEAHGSHFVQGGATVTW